MLTVDEAIKYGRTLARKYRFPDVEEIESVALYGLGLGLSKTAEDNERAKPRLLTFIKNLARNYMRKMAPVTVDQLPDPATDPCIRIEEEIEALKLSPFEQVVLTYRLQGYNDNEIAALVGRNHVYVHRTRHKIQEKYRDSTVRPA